MNEDYIKSDGWFDYQDFYTKMANKPFKVYVELGTWKGYSVAFLTQKILETGKDDFKVYGIDLFEDSSIHLKNNNSHLSDQMPYIYQIYNEVLTRYNVRDHITDIKGYSWETSEHFEDESVDFIFIDADHAYESVKKDIQAWWPKLKKGGIMSGHDYFNPFGVKQAVDEIFSNVQISSDRIWYIEKE
jgi:predicted O-methyltransferase YrrM